MKLIDVLRLTEPQTYINLNGKHLINIAIRTAENILASPRYTDKLSCNVIGINPGDKLNINNEDTIAVPFLFITIDSA